MLVGNDSSMNKTHETTLWDTVVIGASAAGLSAALMLGRSVRKVLVIDSGSPRNRFAEHMHGVLGHEGKPPHELTKAGRAECQRYGIAFADAQVTRVSEDASGLVIRTDDSATLTARTVILATGIEDVLPPITGVTARWGKDVLHCPYCHGWEVKGKKLGVLATSPASVHQAKLIRQWSDQVTYFSALGGELHESDRTLLEARGVVIETRRVESVVSSNAPGDENDTELVVTLEDGIQDSVAALFTAPTPRPHDHMVADLHLARNAETGVIEVNPMGQSSHPRLWAAGNVTNPYANVPMAMGSGSFTGASVNGWLTEDDYA